MDTIKISIPGKPEYKTMIRLDAGSVASMAGFDVETIEDIKNAVNEGCKLVSCHGEERWSDKYIIEYRFELGHMEVSVTDDCVCHTLKKNRKPCMHCPEDGEIGKLLIRTIMDEVEFGRDESNRKFIKMVKSV